MTVGCVAVAALVVVLVAVYCVLYCLFVVMLPGCVLCVEVR